MNKIIKRIEFDPEFIPVHLPIVLKQGTIDAIDQAKEVVHGARQEAQRIRKEAREFLEQAKREREEERRAGYEEGLEEGKRALTQRVVEAESAHEKVLKEAEPEIIKMVMEIAEKVIGRELGKGAIVDVVKKAMTQAVGKKMIIKIHPDDFATLKEQEKELFQTMERTQSISLKEDESVGPGGCMIETELGTVDARLKTQLAGIRKALGLAEKE